MARTDTNPRVPDSTGCVHMNVEKMTEGNLLVLFRSRWADNIYSSKSADNGRTWSKPVPAEFLIIIHQYNLPDLIMDIWQWCPIISIQIVQLNAEYLCMMKLKMRMLKFNRMQSLKPPNQIGVLSKNEIKYN
ncbi:MAG: exo-alpha-sialidase [Sporomusa sp.]